MKLPIAGALDTETSTTILVIQRTVSALEGFRLWRLGQPAPQPPAAPAPNPKK